MNENNLKKYLALVFIFSHFVFLLYVVYVYFIERTLQKENLIATLTIVAPTFASYTTAILTFLIQHRNEESFGETKTNFVFVIISFFITIVFISSLFTIFTIQWRNPMKVDDYSAILAIVETSISIYIAMIIKAIFEEKKKNSKIGQKVPKKS